jgi:hypothetical protein
MYAALFFISQSKPRRFGGKIKKLRAKKEHNGRRRDRADAINQAKRTGIANPVANGGRYSSVVYVR